MAHLHHGKEVTAETVPCPQYHPARLVIPVARRFVYRIVLGQHDLPLPSGLETGIPIDCRVYQLHDLRFSVDEFNYSVPKLFCQNPQPWKSGPRAMHHPGRAGSPNTHRRIG